MNDNFLEKHKLVFAKNLFQKLRQHVLCLAHLPRERSIWATAQFWIIYHLHTIYIPYYIHIKYIPCTHDIHTIYIQCTHDIHTKYIPDTYHIHTIYIPYTYQIHTIYTYLSAHELGKSLAWSRQLKFWASTLSADIEQPRLLKLFFWGPEMGSTWFYSSATYVNIMKNR